MLSRKNRLRLLKMFSLFSVIRGYNILVIVIAQYLTSAFILAPGKGLRYILFDLSLFLIVLAGALAIAGGYIINNFYDSEKDLINRPRKSMLDRLVSQNTKLSIYFVVNFLSIIAASYVSFRAVLFFAAFIFGMWFYSHKLKKLPFIGNLVAATLAITPFFAVFVYYNNWSPVIFVHATFLFLIITMREMVKDLENIKGDMAQDYHTIPIVYGVPIAKRLLTILAVFTLIPVILLLVYFPLGHMHYYFYASVLLLAVFLIILWRSRTQLHYLIGHNILKFIIVSGVFSILLLDIHVVLDRLY